MKTKQDSRNYFESLVFYSKTIQYVINISINFSVPLYYLTS